MDYSKLGFKCGIEIHQQLETHKLFCSCPSIVHDKNPDIKIIRKLRAAAGETGEVDIAAAYEQAQKREFVYEACSTSSCLVELDEEPPHAPNPEAVQIALQIAKLLNAKIVDQIQWMRKTVVDGSNVSGFQRTALIGRDGYIDTSLGKVGITVVCLEEEAAKRISTSKDSVTFRLDRLGVPLVEIGTDASIRSPEHAKETAEKLGMILRSTGNVKRGIGTIRQDVNVSIKGGARTEIKGFQDLKSMPKVIEYEIERQQKLIKERKKVEKEVRKAEPDGTTSFLRPMPGAARMYPETDVEVIDVGEVKVEGVELIEEKLERYKKEYKLVGDIAKMIAKSEKAAWFENFVKKYKNIKPLTIAETLVSTLKEVRRKYTPKVDEMSEGDFAEIFSLLDSGKLSKESLVQAIADKAEGKFDVSKYAQMSDKDLEKEIKKIIEENKGVPVNALIGRVMAKLRGKADGKKIVELVRKLAE
ncbi:Glu-tRNA(Gln) amidotransferase subunit GatE [Candidatus Woesearchaeota archaeon]|nr:Glu-tRNA(Gln) amidotransferase subunit GatE [Candidatus Woesearchaeota archaeon]